MSKNTPFEHDSHCVVHVLDQVRDAPSASHDDHVLRAADRILGPSRCASRRSWRAPAALAASLLLALSVAFQLYQPAQDVPAPVRGASSATVPIPGHRLATVPRLLRWTAVPGASGFRVTLRDASADILWTSAVVTEPQLELPEAALRAIAGLDTCIWSVEVLGNARQRELGPFWFHFAPR